METIHVKFDELIAMASNHDCIEHVLQQFNNNTSSADTMNTSYKEDLDNLFGPMFEEYFEKRSFNTPINSAAQSTQFHKDSPSTSSIIVDAHEAPPIETTSDEQTSPISLTDADEFNQEDSADFNGNLDFVSYNTPSHEEIESSTAALEPSNVQNFHQILRQEEGIDFEEFFAPVARLEAVRMRFMSANLKGLLIQNSQITSTGIVDTTLFTRRHGEDIFLVQVYVDDIIFGSTNLDFSKHFANLMKNNFEMSMMGELKFFLGLQVHQSPRGIFISQSQYAIELLKKHGLDECVSMSTPMATERLDADLQGTPTDQTTYRRMIGGLMYLTASRPDIAYATFVCARYQARPTVKHLKEVKRIFRYLRQSYNMGLWYPKDSGFELIAYSDADHAGCKDDCKSTSGGLQFLGEKLIMQMMYAFINTFKVYYAKPLWEGLYYSLHYLTSSIPYPRFTKIIISHYMTKFHKISRRARDRYHNLKDDDIMKNICNSGRYKDGVGMNIPALGDTSEDYEGTRSHFGCMPEYVWEIDVPLTQSQPTDVTQAMHRTPSSPSSPNPNMDAGVSSALKRLTVIRLCIPQRRSTCLTPPAPSEEQEARENVELVNEHLASVEIKKMVEGTENVIDDSSNPRNDDQNIPGTRLEPRVTRRIYGVMFLKHLRARSVGEAAYLQPCIEQLLVPIHHAGDKTVVGETSLSFALMNVHARAKGAKKHAATLRQLMMEIVYAPLSSQTWVGEASTSAAPLSVEDYTEEYIEGALGSVVAVPKLECCHF
ncbi:retrovirus-related pol polyprotein from transposon TNT 1-94 [Tanacetum coccineum]